MATDMVLDFYESINFELIDIDGYDMCRRLTKMQSSRVKSQRLSTGNKAAGR